MASRIGLRLIQASTPSASRTLQLAMKSGANFANPLTMVQTAAHHSHIILAAAVVVASPLAKINECRADIPAS